MAVARKHKAMGLPLDAIVVDFFHWTRQGDFKFEPLDWPDPDAMVKELKDMGVETVVSVWPTIDEKSENFGTMADHGYIVRTDRDICADLITDTKSVKTALNRFFRAVKNHKLFADWEDEIREGVENGYYKINEYEYTGFIWEVEEHDGSYYIMIKMKNEYIEAVA